MPDSPALDALRGVAGDLAGLPLTHARKGHGPSLFLEFGPLIPGISSPRGSFSISLFYYWRIEAGGRVHCASDGDRETWEARFQDLIGKKIVSLEAFGELSELRLVLDDDFRLTTFALDDDGPDWTVTDHRQEDPLARRRSVRGRRRTALVLLKSGPIHDRICPNSLRTTY
ncbi:hypothetical protein ACFSM5_08775 [Lacibacterium aquatile]|uniref:Uncharacterized protein n=1 Tax=Lacibacterium aquatile TaxID=1168082 RepID=A0ABW5DPD6_9PROT